MQEDGSASANNKTSAYTGVVYSKRRRKWLAKINVNGKRRQVGEYATEVEAAQAADDYRLAFGVPIHELNFPSRAQMRMQPVHELS